MRIEHWGNLTVRITGGLDGAGSGSGPVVILLHGFGATGDDLVPLAQALELPSAVRFVFPEAPIPLGLNFGFGEARAWWWVDTTQFERALHLGQLDKLMDAVPDGLLKASQSIQSLVRFIQHEWSVSSEQIILGGFSQGAMLALDAALRANTRWKGLALLSTAIVDRTYWLQALPALQGCPVFQSHGYDDPILPFSVATQLRDALVSAKLNVKWVPFQGGHTIPAEVLQELTKFVNTLEVNPNQREH